MIQYTDPDPEWEDTTVAETPDYDQCKWKTLTYDDPNQQYGDDIDDPLERETYPD